MARKARIDLLQGTLDLLILETLRSGPAHGHAVSKSIHLRSGERLQVETGSLYPALHRLEAEGWIDAKWAISDKGKRAKYYRLTPAGKKQLAQEHSRWAELTRAIAMV